jgi:hypothetical protein
MNIPKIRLKIKNSVERTVGEWGLIALIILVGAACFGLGRLSALEEGKPLVAVREASVALEMREMHMGGLVVASRKGSAYHFPWCAGAQSIAAQNKVWFSSVEAAQAAGYAPAKNCKGLH